MFADWRKAFVNGRFGGVCAAVVVAVATLGAWSADAAAPRSGGDAAGISAGAIGLSGVRLGGDADATRVVLDLDAAASGRLDAGEASAGRLVVNLPAMLSSGPMEGKGLGLVRAWSLRSSAQGERLVLEVAPGVTVERRFLIPPTGEADHWRYVIDLRPGSSAGSVASMAAVGGATAVRPATSPPRGSTSAQTPAAASVFAASAGATGGWPKPRYAIGEPPARRLSTPIAAPTASPVVQAALDAVKPAPDPELAGGAHIVSQPALPAQSAVRTPATAPRAAVPGAVAASPRQASGRAPVGHGLKVVVIDAGHGGHDTGAQSLVRNEKDITLAAALSLRTRLLRTGRYKVVMTRDSDVFIPLADRVQIARRAGADLFISLHADSAGSNPTPHGASVYTLSDHGQTRVNYVLGPHELFARPGGGSDQGVRQILLDLAQTTTRNRSSQFAGLLLDHIADRVDLLPRSHRDAGYFVLLAPDVPAVLLEMGFITNPADEFRLTDPEQRDRLMDGVADAIDAYFTGGPRLAAG